PHFLEPHPCQLFAQGDVFLQETIPFGAVSESVDEKASKLINRFLGGIINEFLGIGENVLEPSLGPARLDLQIEPASAIRKPHRKVNLSARSSRKFVIRFRERQISGSAQTREEETLYVSFTGNGQAKITDVLVNLRQRGAVQHLIAEDVCRTCQNPQQVSLI